MHDELRAEIQGKGDNILKPEKRYSIYTCLFVHFHCTLTVLLGHRRSKTTPRHVGEVVSHKHSK